MKWAIISWTAVALVWIVFEGNLGLTIFFAALTAFIIVGVFAKKFLSGRELSLGMGLFTTALLGFFFGLGSAFLALFFMALKTGLHAHGPEFTFFEINWVIEQIPIWAATGLVAGLGVGLLLRASYKPEN